MTNLSWKYYEIQIILKITYYNINLLLEKIQSFIKNNSLIRLTRGSVIFVDKHVEHIQSMLA